MELILYQFFINSSNRITLKFSMPSTFSQEHPQKRTGLYTNGTAFDEQEMNTLHKTVSFSSVYNKQDPKKVFPEYQEDVVDLLYRMLDYNPNTRITAEEVGVV